VAASGQTARSRFSQEDQKDRRAEISGFALPPLGWCALRAEWRGEQSNLLIF
jgi:hypothetical protein